MPDASTAALWIGIAFLAAGLVKGVVGMGLPTVAMGLLSLVMLPPAAAAMLIAPSLVTNIWQMLAGPAIGALLRRLASMLFAAFVGTLLGIGVLTAQPAPLVGALLGAVLMLYGVVGLTAPRWSVPARFEPWLSPVVGLITGLIAGATGIFVMPAVPYLGALGLSREELIQALGLSFTMSTVALACGLGFSGNFGLADASTSLLAVAPALLGMFLGQRLRRGLAPETFRRWFFAGLVTLGGVMLSRGLAA